MKNTTTSVFSNGLIWFGAAVSIAEIMTGTLLAPLGFGKGILAIIIGHAIGCFLLFLAGSIGATTKKSGMETVKLSFGQKGSLLFSTLNIVQLIGWTAVMILAAAKSIGVALNAEDSAGGSWLWCLLIGALIILWIVIGIQNLGKINAFTMSTLFLLTIVLSFVVFRCDGSGQLAGAMSFGGAVELSAAMPLSWLPLISDYTRSAKNPKVATGISALTYFFASCWMYAIGLGAAIFTGQTDIAQIMMQAGMGLLAVIIIIASTVTTTFLDVYSAGVSFVSISNRAKEKWIAIIACLLGTFLAMLTPIEQYENFLYLIGSVFVPMIAILITDFYLLKKSHAEKSVNVMNLIIWLCGFILYRFFLSVDTLIGSTFPVMIIISLICILVNGGKSYVQNNITKGER